MRYGPLTAGSAGSKVTVLNPLLVLATIENASVAAAAFEREALAKSSRMRAPLDSGRMPLILYFLLPPPCNFGAILSSTDGARVDWQKRKPGRLPRSALRRASVEPCTSQAAPPSRQYLYLMWVYNAQRHPRASH